MKTDIEKVRGLLDKSIIENGLHHGKTKALDKTLHDLVVVEQARILGIKSKENFENGINITKEKENLTISYDVPAGVFEVTDYGLYINNETLETMLTDKLKQVADKNKKYIVNMQVDICLIDPLKEEFKVSGGTND